MHGHGTQHTRSRYRRIYANVFSQLVTTAEFSRLNSLIIFEHTQTHTHTQRQRERENIQPTELSSVERLQFCHSWILIAIKMVTDETWILPSATSNTTKNQTQTIAITTHHLTAIERHFLFTLFHRHKCFLFFSQSFVRPRLILGTCQRQYQLQLFQMLGKKRKLCVARQLSLPHTLN